MSIDVFVFSYNLSTPSQGSPEKNIPEAESWLVKWLNSCGVRYFSKLPSLSLCQRQKKTKQKKKTEYKCNLLWGRVNSLKWETAHTSIPVSKVFNWCKTDVGCLIVGRRGRLFISYMSAPWWTGDLSRVYPAVAQCQLGSSSLCIVCFDFAIMPLCVSSFSFPCVFLPLCLFPSLPHLSFSLLTHLTCSWSPR